MSDTDSEAKLSGRTGRFEDEPGGHIYIYCEVNFFLELKILYES